MGIPNTISKLVSEKRTIGDKRGAHKIFKTAFLVFVSIATAFSLMLFFGAGFISNNILNNPGCKIYAYGRYGSCNYICINVSCFKRLLY